MIIDFDRFQSTSIGNTCTKNDACREMRRKGTHTLICELCLIIFKSRIKHAYCFLESFVEPRKLSFNVEMVRCFIFFFNILNIQSPTLRSLHNAALFDSCLSLQINNQLKTLWLSAFIDKFNLSIDNYRQISSTIDLSTTLSMIDFDRHVTSCK